jgi:hypothetical protein
VSFHAVAENDNSHMDLAIKQGFGVVAGKTNAAGEIFHHPGKPKPGQAETAVEDGRGASAILWAVRSARVLNFMTPDDAARLGMSDDERKLYIRIANGKANMGPLGKAKWMRIEVENLPNGDQVACASPWTPQNPFENVTVAHVELARGLAQTAAYRADSRSPEWFGNALAGLLGINVSADGAIDKKARVRVKQIITTWLKNNVLRIEKRKDAGRKDREYILPGTNGAPLAPRPIGRVSDDDEVILQ